MYSYNDQGDLCTVTMIQGMYCTITIIKLFLYEALWKNLNGMYIYGQIQA